MSLLSASCRANCQRHAASLRYQTTMMSAGDVRGWLRNLEALLRVLRYPGQVDYSGLSRGDPSTVLPILSFTLTSFSPPVAEQLLTAGLELTGKTDLRFTDTLYKVLRDVFHYKPILTQQQFLQWGFSQKKISVMCDIINLVLQKHNQLKKVTKRPQVVNQVETPPTFPTNSSHVEVFSSHSVPDASRDEVYSADSPGHGMTELQRGDKDEDDGVHSSEVERRVSVLEAQLQIHQCLVDRLGVLEERLEELETRTNTHKDEGEFITVPRDSWDDLTTRVLLLETKLELSGPQL
ncbi:centrosomal protein of 44 kDa isoform X2 [Brachyistius frenatus]|uniref:centrosomal protein of 44 kDa isoform X2 n=1 Tax=Brachyistius frenatus TaxID=100188 RepID=UPI0037E90726